MHRPTALAFMFLFGCKSLPTPAADATTVVSDALRIDRVSVDATAAPDATTPADAAADVPSTEVPAADAGAQRDAAEAAAPEDSCAPARVLDLNALGTRAGATTTVLGTNALAARSSTLDAPCAAGMTGHVVVYRYTPRATGRLRISTNLEGTAMRLDTVVFAMTSCDAARRIIGCGDDTGDPPRDHASTFVTDENVTAGQAVFIAVGGFLHATRELWDSQGGFALAVTEQ